MKRIDKNSWIRRTNSLGFVALYLFVFGLLIFKAFKLPVTHDESWTASIYIKESIWNIITYFDGSTNNHILNSLLSKLSVKLFGLHDWSIRLPNLLFYALYAVGVYRFLQSTIGKERLMFLALALLFISNPYFLDFFSLCRGYGISSALIMLSISYFVSGYKLGADRHIWIAFVLSMLASYSNFTALLYFGSSIFLLGLYILLFTESKREVRMNLFRGFLFVSCYLLLTILPLMRIKSTDQFVYWTSKGFYQETMISLTQFSLSDTRVFNNFHIVALCLCFLIGASLLVLIFYTIRAKFRKEVLREPITVLGIVVLIVFISNLLQTKIFGDPNLNGRTAIFLIPIVVSYTIALIAKLDKGITRKSSLILTAVIAIVAIQHLSTTFMLSSFREWRYDAHTKEVLGDIRNKLPSNGRVSLKCHWLYQNSFYFYSENDKQYNWFDLDVDWSTHELDKRSEVDYYYIPAEFESLLSERYMPFQFYDGGHLLMKSKFQSK